MESDLTQFLSEEYQTTWKNYIEPKTPLEQYKEYLRRPFATPPEKSLRRQELIKEGKARY